MPPALRGPFRRDTIRVVCIDRLRRLMVWAAALLCVAGLQLGCASLDERQREWIFQPGDRTWWGGLEAAKGMEDVWIRFDAPAADGQAGGPVALHGLWLARPEPDAPVLLYLHGARFDVRGSAPRMRRMHALGFSVLGIDYRGFGRSTRALPSERMAVDDARAAWAWLAEHHPQTRRFIFVHSLGGAIAVELASQVKDEAGLIVESSFTSIPDVVSTFRWGWLPVAPLITQRFNAAARVAEAGSPVLVVHGSDDDLIPPRLGRELFAQAREPKRFMLVEGASHHDTNLVGQPQYRQALTELFGVTVPTEVKDLSIASPG